MDKAPHSYPPPSTYHHCSIPLCNNTWSREVGFVMGGAAKFP